MAGPLAGRQPGKIADHSVRSMGNPSAQGVVTARTCPGSTTVMVPAHAHWQVAF